jgi:hypothetical protein
MHVFVLAYKYPKRQASKTPLTPAFLLDKRSGSVTPVEVHSQPIYEALLSLDNNDTFRIVPRGIFSDAGSKFRVPVLTIAANRNILIPLIKSQINITVKKFTSLWDVWKQISPFLTYTFIKLLNSEIVRY